MTYMCFLVLLLTIFGLTSATLMFSEEKNNSPASNSTNENTPVMPQPDQMNPIPVFSNNTTPSIKDPNNTYQNTPITVQPVTDQPVTDQPIQTNPNPYPYNIYPGFNGVYEYKPSTETTGTSQLSFLQTIVGEKIGNVPTICEVQNYNKLQVSIVFGNDYGKYVYTEVPHGDNWYDNVQPNYKKKIFFPTGFLLLQGVSPYKYEETPGTMKFQIIVGGRNGPQFEANVVSKCNNSGNLRGTSSNCREFSFVEKQIITQKVGCVAYMMRGPEENLLTGPFLIELKGKIAEVVFNTPYKPVSVLDTSRKIVKKIVYQIRKLMKGIPTI